MSSKRPNLLNFLENKVSFELNIMVGHKNWVLLEGMADTSGVERDLKTVSQDRIGESK